MAKGRVLCPGDTIGVVAPSGPLPVDTLNEGIARLEGWGFKVALGEHVLARHGYLAGTDEQRAADFNAMWVRDDVAGIICARGGYGAMRILDQIDWDMVAARPKFFCGFSDITALHTALAHRAGLVSFHGPMVGAFGDEVAHAYNEAGLWRALTTCEPLGEVAWPGPGPGAEAPGPLTIRAGVAEGCLTGGNLSLLAALMGTPYEPDFTDRIVLLEDVDEAPYRVDRMLVQLLLAGKLQRAAGILFGDSPTCMCGTAGKPSLTLPEVFRELLAPLQIPVLYGFPCGHSPYRATLPLGARVQLDAGAARLTILEPALLPR